MRGHQTKLQTVRNTNVITCNDFYKMFGRKSAIYNKFLISFHKKLLWLSVAKQMTIFNEKKGYHRFSFTAHCLSMLSITRSKSSRDSSHRRNDGSTTDHFVLRTSESERRARARMSERLECSDSEPPSSEASRRWRKRCKSFAALKAENAVHIIRISTGACELYTKTHFFVPLRFSFSATRFRHSFPLFPTRSGSLWAR